ncbi:restriction endonuclease subunit S [Methylocystis iwaonis]|uniref:Type I restriction modification DNA specificity domain-containing protein n=1 Tax=Methylocystis iwaonis TaxID=2885079 RepID=A0ABN6VJA8_9HYPH|nr:restriction endonuclease subunit S [Methylocystis iwaonis]BDV35763.1 hypothetical protein SS37A_32920 [Methylocystis iwaonis]
MNNWVVYSLAALTENLDSRRKPVKEADRKRGPFPYYGASGVVDYVDDYLFEGLHLLIAEDGENLRTRKLPIAFLADGKFWVNNHAHIVRGNDKADTRFLHYALQIADVTSYLSGSTMPKLTQANLSRIPIRAPDIDTQRAIASVLSALDDKIELNRRMNETLEQMAQAIFRDWFVDFGPVRRKQEGASDPIAIMGGLVQNAVRADELAALFPDTLGDDGVPAGWSPSELGKLFEIKIGRTPPRKERHHFVGNEADGIPWLSIRDLGTCGTFAHSTSECLTADAVNEFRVPLIEKGTVLVSFKLTVGRVAIAERQMLSNEAIAQLAIKAESPPTAFTYSFMKQFDYSLLEGVMHSVLRSRLRV